MPKIKVNDISIYYESHGSGEPIFFIGGFSVDHTAWLGLLDKFNDKYQLVLCDNRGAGRSDVPEGPYSIEQMADDIAQLCSEIDIERAHFVGNSMGGMILQTLSLKYPALVQSAILSNTAPNLQTPFFVFMKAQLELLKAKAPMEELIKANCSWVYSYQYLSQPQAIDLLVQLIMDNPYPFTEKGYAGQFGAVEQFDFWDSLPQIKVPTLVVGSEHDLIFNENCVKALAEQIPNAHYYGFENCGHLPYIEHPDLFAKVVKDFIADK